MKDYAKQQHKQNPVKLWWKRWTRRMRKAATITRNIIVVGVEFGYVDPEASAKAYREVIFR